MPRYLEIRDHAIVGTRDVQLIELYWQSGQGVHQDIWDTSSNTFSCYLWIEPSP
jgi:hypothetical protein